MSYIPEQARDQLVLFQTRYDEIIPQDNWVRALAEILDDLYLSSAEFREKLRTCTSKKDRAPQGRPKYREILLILILLFGYIKKITSSRELEEACEFDRRLNWLLGDLKPDHWTINNFRKHSKELLEYIERELRKRLQKRELIEGKVVAVDGTKVIANTSRNYYDAALLVKALHRVEYRMSEYLEQLSILDDKEALQERKEERHQQEKEAIIQGALEERNQLEAEHQNERKQLEAEHQNEQTKWTTEKEALLAKISKLERGREDLREAEKHMQASGKKYYCPTDPDARVMKTKEGSRGAYNLQIAVDQKNKFILSSSVVQQETDIHQLSPMVEQIIEDLGKAPETIIADAGYNHYDSIEKLESETETEYYVNQNNPKTEKQDKQEDEITFRYNEEADEIECSEGGRLVLVEKNQKHKGSKRDRYRGIDCTNCKKRNQCTTSRKGRTVYRYHNQKNRDAYKQKMELPESKKILNKRKGIVEHVFGDIKNMMGRTQLLLRGLEGAIVEMKLCAISYNLKKMIKMTKKEEKKWSFA